MTEMMKAVRYHEYGGPEALVVEQVPKPEPGLGQVLVRIHAASVNPVDWRLREGEMKAFIQIQFPATVGRDLAGVIEAVSEDVHGLRPGDEVFAVMPREAFGAYAEYAVLDQSAVALKPKTLDFVQAAAFPMSALTAWQGVVETGGIKAGDSLFVHAAAGSVGGIAVQIGRALGVHVTAAASAEARSLVEGYGAERFVDYKAERFEETVRDQDVVFDTLAGEMQTRSWGMLKPNGIMVSTLGIVDPDKAKEFGVRATSIVCTPNAEQLGRVAEMIDAGKIRPNVGAVLTLDDAAKAQELNRTGTVKGKIVLTVP